LNATLANLKRFFQWLSGQAGYKSRFHYTDADYFNLSEKDVRIATAKRSQKAPTLAQVNHVLAQMPFASDIERRNRALLAFTLLTGARDSAIASMKLKHVDLVANCTIQDAREVNTKISKTFTTYFFPVGDEALSMLVDWVGYLRDNLLWGNDAPLFPSTFMKVGASNQFEVAGLKRECWRTASPIRKIFKEAFERAGLTYFNPHSFRHLLVRHGEALCKSPEEFKAWSQNLGHEGVLTTFYSYGDVQESRQAEIFKEFKEPRVGNGGHTFDVDELARALMKRMSLQNAG
jgi:integrase/recombinase XerD